MLWKACVSFWDARKVSNLQGSGIFRVSFCLKFENPPDQLWKRQHFINAHKNTERKSWDSRIPFQWNLERLCQWILKGTQKSGGPPPKVVGKHLGLRPPGMDPASWTKGNEVLHSRSLCITSFTRIFTLHVSRIDFNAEIGQPANQSCD